MAGHGPVREVQVERGGDLVCHRCEGPLLLTVRVPHSLRRADGHVVAGTRTVGLCERCDRDDTAAQGVLAYFTVHEKITADSVEDIGSMLAAWMDAPPIFTDVELDEEIAEWETGNL